MPTRNGVSSFPSRLAYVRSGCGPPLEAQAATTATNMAATRMRYQQPTRLTRTRMIPSRSVLRDQTSRARERIRKPRFLPALAIEVLRREPPLEPAADARPVRVDRREPRRVPVLSLD